jgi:predicted Zn-dependent protease
MPNPQLHLWVLLLVASCGCAAHPSRAAWVQDHGGLAASPEQAYLQKVVGRIVPKYPSGHGQITVEVLDANDLAAFSWDDGQIYLTRGLISILDEQELVAVVAHELGHLLEDNHAQVISALQGCERDLDAESRADRIGIELMRAQGFSPSAMPRMLRRVIASHCWSPECERKLQLRLEALTRTSGK